MATTNFDTDVRHGGELGVHGASHKIGKPAQRKPVIIYMVSPKIIHVEANEFMSLVQRLTGPDASGHKRASSDGVSPKASTGARTGRKADKDGRTVPVRVKARPLNRKGPVVSVTATRPSPSLATPSAFLFHDLSISPTLRGTALKGEGSAASPSWFQHSSDHFLSPGPVFGSPSGYLDIFGQLPSQQ